MLKKDDIAVAAINRFDKAVFELKQLNKMQFVLKEEAPSSNFRQRIYLRK